MFRIKLAMLMGGLVLAYFGVQEYRVSMGTSTEPLAIELAAIEGGEIPSCNHLKVGKHVADYVGCVYEYEERYGKTSITHLYYPIISHDNSFFTELGALYEKYGDPNDIPDEEYPEIHNFHVLVKTKRFKTESSIPEGLNAENEIQGLVINLVDSLDAEEKSMIQEDFPEVNLDQVLILEDGRKPASMATSLGMTGGGVLMSLLGLVWLMMGLADGTWKN
ncbi:hypothetical protein N9Y42_09740 [Mariniblastus sp.]|nr:hypothetical protein [Mariniblastus sp.]